MLTAANKGKETVLQNKQIGLSSVQIGTQSFSPCKSGKAICLCRKNPAPLLTPRPSWLAWGVHYRRGKDVLTPIGLETAIN